jgi:hypothetical protein
MRSFHSINEALLVLLSNTDDTASMRDYRSITIIHIIGKLFAKVLACRLAPHLSELVCTRARAPSSKVGASMITSAS